MNEFSDFVRMVHSAAVSAVVATAESLVVKEVIQ